MGEWEEGSGAIDGLERQGVRREKADATDRIGLLALSDRYEIFGSELPRCNKGAVGQFLTRAMQQTIPRRGRQSRGEASGGRPLNALPSRPFET
jgi:hypothetical protein